MVVTKDVTLNVDCAVEVRFGAAKITELSLAYC
jgi:hypothetical protein